MCVTLLVRSCLPVALILSTGAMSPGGPQRLPANGRSLLRAYELSVNARIPAFARKYGLRCSVCHTAWPELSAFGQRFKDNGYQLGNDRDSPIWQSNGYWPIAMRTTPQWHFESTTNQITDAAASGKTVSQLGFDLSGVDFLLLGTLYKDITFGLVPTLDADGTTGLEAAFVRFDNLGNSPWANLKVGKFELDFDEGDLYFQSSQILPEGHLDDEIIHRLIGTTMSMLDIYLPAIMSVIYGNELPIDAVKHAEPGRSGTSEGSDSKADE